MVAILLPLALCAVHLPFSMGSKFIFNFGDSYSSSGFNISNTKPSDSPGNQMGNPAPGTSTSCGSGCVNWLETLVTKYSPGNYLGYNFARPGALYSHDAVNSSVSREYELEWQVNKFLTTVGTTPRQSYAAWTATNAVATLWFGTNDFLSIIPEHDDDGASPYATQDAVTRMINNDLTAATLNLGTLYAAGLRQFVILGTPPLERCPGFALSGRSRSAQGNITYFNNAYQYYAAYYTSLYPGTKVVVKDPKPYWDAVESNKSNQVWQDVIHPAPPIHSAVAYGVRGILQSDPFNFY